MTTVHLVAHAISNENFEAIGGFHGEQSGFELNATRWYANDWNIVFRANDEEKREQIAQFAEKAVVNGFIGYSQNVPERNSMLKAIKENNIDVSEINTNVCCDCSSLAYACVYLAFDVPFATTIEYGAPVTSNFESYIDTITGEFTKYTDEAYTTSEELLLRGDIILNSSAHVCIYI